MAKKKKPTIQVKWPVTKTHTGQAGVVGVKKPTMDVIEISPNSIKKTLAKIKKKKWDIVKKDFKKHFCPGGGSLCYYSPTQIEEILYFFEQKFTE